MAAPDVREERGARPMISVVMPHYEQPALLARCLETLAAQRRRPDEVIVVDNGSKEMPEAVCAAHPGTRLLREEGRGPGLARNAGIAAARGEVIALIDSDCLADPGWLEAAEREILRPGTDVLGGDVRVTVADPARPDGIEAYELIYAYRMDRYIAREGYTGTGNLIAWRRVFDAVGGFGGLGTAEDMEWGQRATAMGFALRFVPDMKVLHPAHEDVESLLRKWDRHTVHFWEASRGRRWGRARWAVRMAAMPVSPLGEIPRIAASDRLPDLSARVRAFRVLSRIRRYRGRLMWRLLTRGEGAGLLGSWRGEA